MAILYDELNTSTKYSKLLMKFKERKTGRMPNTGNKKNIEIAVPLKY